MTVSATAVAALNLTSRGRRLSRSIIYGSVIAAFGVVYGTVVYVVAMKWGVPTLTGSVQIFAVAFVLSLAIGMPLHARVQANIDNWLKGGARTVDTLHELFARLTTGSAIGNLTRHALKIVSANVGLQRAMLFLLSAQRREFVPVATSDDDLQVHESLPVDHPLCEILAMLHVEIGRTTLRQQTRYASIRPECLAALDRVRADALFPVEVESRLVGFLALAGGRIDILAPGEIEILRALSAEFSVCAARAQDDERLRSARLDLERFARYLPKSVSRDVLDGTFSAEHGRRRNVTIVDCQIGGFVALTELGDPAELGEALRRFYAFAAAETRREGGTLASVSAARVAMVFGDPDPQPDHALRALRTAARLMPEARQLCTEWRQHVPDLDVQVGVATGVAFVGFLAFGSELTYQVMGPPAQEARALASSGKNGELLLSESTLLATRSLVQVEPVDVRSESIRSGVAYRLIAIDPSGQHSSVKSRPSTE